MPLLSLRSSRSNSSHQLLPSHLHHPQPQLAFALAFLSTSLKLHTGRVQSDSNPFATSLGLRLQKSGQLFWKTDHLQISFQVQRRAVVILFKEKAPPTHETVSMLFVALLAWLLANCCALCKADPDFPAVFFSAKLQLRLSLSWNRVEIIRLQEGSRRRAMIGCQTRAPKAGKLEWSWQSSLKICSWLRCKMRWTVLFSGRSEGHAVSRKNRSLMFAHMSGRLR